MKLGRILKLNLISIINSFKPYYKEKVKIGQVLSCGHGVLDFSVHSLQTQSFFFSLLIYLRKRNFTIIL